jgi:signal peptidase
MWNQLVDGVFVIDERFLMPDLPPRETSISIRVISEPAARPAPEIVKKPKAKISPDAYGSGFRLERRKKSRAKSIVLNTIVYFLIVGGIIFGLPRALSSVLNTSFPMAAITSGSMWPDLKVGSLVFIEGIDGHEVQVGDIIVYQNRKNNTFTIHRVVKLNENTLVTKGDANFKDDEPISYSDIIGRTVEVFGKPARIPYLGSITVFASNLK